MHRRPGDLGYEAFVQTVRSYEMTKALFTQRVAEMGMATVEFDVLGTASDLGETSQPEIADQLLVTKAGVGKVLARLEERGLVRRRARADDGRVRLVTLTPEGHTLLDRLRSVQDEIIDATLGSLPRAEQEALLASMQRVETLAHEARQK